MARVNQLNYERGNLLLGFRSYIILAVEDLEKEMDSRIQQNTGDVAMVLESGDSLTNCARDRR